MRYGAILMDPPWAFRTYTKKLNLPQRAAGAHYGLMSFNDMSALPVSEMAEKNCALFMWAVDSHLDEAIALGKSFGFTFKTRAFTWRKTTQDGLRAAMGMGLWTRKQSELCLLFTKGKPKRLSGGVREIIDAPRREHSRKPDEIYTRVEALVAGPYLEMFARQRRSGWDAWGNEIDKFEAAA